MTKDHEHYMIQALDQARMAASIDEVPVGAVLVDQRGEILAEAYNKPISTVDPTAHAEIQTLRAGALKLMNYRLLNTTLYVTIEPCIMCMGAIVHARLTRIVYGAPDPKWGAAGSLYNLAEDQRLNHRPEVIGGILAEQCKGLIQNFFRAKRGSVRSKHTNSGPIN